MGGLGRRGPSACAGQLITLLNGGSSGQGTDLITVMKALRMLRLLKVRAAPCCDAGAVL